MRKCGIGFIQGCVANVRQRGLCNRLTKFILQFFMLLTATFMTWVTVVAKSAQIFGYLLTCVPSGYSSVIYRY